MRPTRKKANYQSWFHAWVLRPRESETARWSVPGDWHCEHCSRCFRVVQLRLHAGSRSADRQRQRCQFGGEHFRRREGWEWCAHRNRRASSHEQLTWFALASTWGRGPSQRAADENPLPFYMCAKHARRYAGSNHFELGRTGSPVHAFSKPIISRSTENVSRVLHHPWSTSNGSS